MNNFNSKSSCNKKCRPELDKIIQSQDDEEMTVDEICSLPSLNGVCSGSEERYYYDILAEGCQKFNFTGCGGNKNNFYSSKECVHFCT